MPVDTTAWITALLFGLLLGWSVTRIPEDRSLGVKALAVLIALGLGAWVLGPDPNSQHAMAAVSMTFAGASALAVALLARASRPDT
jgi:hypothetical protein